MYQTQTKILKDFWQKKAPNLNDLGKQFVETYFIDNVKNEKPRPIITVSQLRKFLSGVNAVQNKFSVLSGDKPEKEAEILNEVQYLRIKLAYQAGREKSIKPVQLELDPIIAQIKSKDEFNVFARLIESVVAYHKYYGGDK